MEKKIRYHNFDIIRVIAAIMVIYSHSFVLSGVSEPSAIIFRNTFGGLGVAIFLMISGFLVSQSWERTRAFSKYMKARVLRIIPGLFVSILFCVFIIGPLVTTLPLIDYFHNRVTLDFFRNISMYSLRYSLPGVFESNPYKYAVNGSLWTLCYEFSFYIILAVASIVIKKRFKTIKLSILFLIAGLIGMQLISIHSINIKSINVGLFINLFTYFSVGFVYNEFQRYIPMNKVLFATALIAVAISTQHSGLSDYGFMLFGAYSLFYFGTHKKYQFNLVSKGGDLSYGLYIYAFPIQQTVSYFFNKDITPTINFRISLVVTIIIAYGSWHLVEKKCLQLKLKSFEAKIIS